MTRPPWHQPPDPGTLTWVERCAGAGWRVVRAQRLTGGIATATDAIDLEGPGDTTLRLVLRRWLRPGWAGDDPDATAAREAVVLDRLARAGVPAPRLVAVDPDGAFAGVPALLMTHLDGRRPSFADEARPRRIAVMGEAAAAIHAVDEGLRDVVGPFRPYTPLDWYAVPDWACRPRLWSAALARLVVAPPTGIQTGFIHGDLHPGNTIWLGGRLSGIVDWTGAAWGPPAADLGHWRANLGTRHGIEVADLALAAYHAAAGATPDRQAWWDLRMLLDYVTDLDATPPGVPERTEAYLAALLDRV